MTVVRVTKEALMMIVEERIDHILKANHDYGDAWQTNGSFTPLMRMKEKLIRVETLSDGRQALIENEKVETNVAEVFDYSLLWLLWRSLNPDISKILDKHSKRVYTEVLFRDIDGNEIGYVGDDGYYHKGKRG